MKYGIEELSLNPGTNKGQVSLPIASISGIKLKRFLRPFNVLQKSAKRTHRGRRVQVNEKKS